MLKLSLAALLALSTASVAACSSSGDRDTPESEDALETARTAYKYECSTSRRSEVMGQQRVDMTISSRQLTFETDDGENTGTRDKKYKSPRGTSRARFTDYGWGDDCDFRIVADTSAFNGATSPEVRVQCSNDDEFRQDVFKCKNPQRVRLETPRPEEPTPEQPTPGSNASKWRCTSAGARVLGDTFELRIDENAMALDDGEFDFNGVRDARYRSRSGTRIGYQDFGYGGDCYLTIAVDKSVLQSSSDDIGLQVRCKSDDEYQKDDYTCERRAR